MLLPYFKRLILTAMLNKLIIYIKIFINKFLILCVSNNTFNNYFHLSQFCVVLDTLSLFLPMLPDLAIMHNDE